MNEHKFATWFFIFVIILCAGIVAWAFFLNKGNLVVTGEPPFQFSVLGEEILCEVNSCEITLKTGNYIVRGEKTGFVPIEKNVDVKWRKKAEINFDFLFIPVVEKIEALPDLPAAAVPPIFEFSFRDIEGKNMQGLYKNDELITQFKKAFDDAAFFPSLNGLRAVMRGEQNNEIVFLLLNLEEKSRAALDIPDTQLKWLNDKWIAWEVVEEGVVTTKLRNIENEKTAGISAPLSNISAAEESAIFLAQFTELKVDKTFGSFVGETGDAIDEALSKETQTVWKLVEFNFSSQTQIVLMELGTEISNVTEFFGLSEDEKSAYFVNSDGVFEIRLLP